jgi:penicillin amidase
MKKYFYLILAVVWIAVIHIPFGSIPPIGNLLTISTGILNVIPPDISDDDRMHISHNEYSGNVYIDSLQIPHVFAKTDEDADFIIGYLHARERFFQMELIVRMMQGRLSEIAGKSTVEVDAYWRNYLLEEKAISEFNRIKTDYPFLHRRILAYAKGVNHYLNSGKYTEKPIEYHLLAVNPMPWKPYYSLLLIDYMSNMLTHSTTDLYYQKLVQKLPQNLLDVYYPMQESKIRPIIPEKSQYKNERTSKDVHINQSVISGNQMDVLNIQLKEIIGSNSWVVSGKKSQSGESMLSNDMHLGLSLPPPWYEIHVKTERKHVYGLSLPAAPVVIAGFNAASSWGITNAHWDLIDYYIPDYQSETELKYGNKIIPIRVINDSIRVKNSDPIPIQIKKTSVGPILVKDDIEYLVQWIGDRGQNILMSFVMLETTSNYSEFLDALSHFESPPQNMVYADTAGNIGHITAGKMPIKLPGYERGVFKSSNPDAIWNGYVPYEEQPQIFNPEKGYIATANQRQIYNSKHYYNWSVMSPHYRGNRISQMIEEKELLTPNDLKVIQADIVDLTAKDLVPRLIQIIQKDRRFSKYVSILESWDYRMDETLVAPTIYNEFRIQFVNEIGRLLKLEDGTTSIRGRSTQSDMKPPSQPLIDLARDSEFLPTDTGEISTEQIIVSAFDIAVNKILLGSKSDNGNIPIYGKYHTSKLRHLMRIPQLSYPEFSNHGSRYTVNVSSKNGAHGSSQRSVIHMTTPIEAYFNIAGGQSGRPSSSYYSNQIKDWKDVTYHVAQFVDQPDLLKHIVMMKTFGVEND